MANWCWYSLKVEGDGWNAFIDWMAAHVKMELISDQAEWVYEDGESWSFLKGSTQDANVATWYTEIPGGVKIVGEKKWSPPSVREWAGMFPALTFRVRWWVEHGMSEEWELRGDQEKCISQVLVGEQGEPDIVHVKDGVCVDPPPDEGEGQAPDAPKEDAPVPDSGDPSSGRDANE